MSMTTPQIRSTRSQNEPSARGSASVGSLRDIEILHDPRLNKSTGFTEGEREALGLVGLVPDVTESMEKQLDRILKQLERSQRESNPECRPGRTPRARPPEDARSPPVYGGSPE